MIKNKTKYKASQSNSLITINGQEDSSNTENIIENSHTTDYTDNNDNTNNTNESKSLLDTISNMAEEEFLNYHQNYINKYYTTAAIKKTIKHEFGADRFGKAETFDITKGEYKVGQVSLLKRSFQIGENIFGVIQFKELMCYQFSVYLQTVEKINPKLKNPSRGGSGSIRTVFAEKHEYTVNYTNTHFMFTIPMDSTHHFHSDLVMLKWMLTFDFVIGAERIEPGEIGGSKGGKVVVDSLSWGLPILVIPVAPLNSSQDSDQGIQSFSLSL